MGGIFIIELHRNTYMTPSELEKELDIQVLGYVQPILTEKDERFNKINFISSVSVAIICIVIALGTYVMTIKGKDHIIHYFSKIFT